MRFEGVCIPVSGSWSSPFVRWQGPAAEISSLDLALQVTGDALRRSGVDWPIAELVLGITVPQKEAFYGAPTLANRLGLGDISGPMVAQACATSVTCVHWAAANQQGVGDGARLVVATDRTSNGPHLVYPTNASPGGTPVSENWVLDNFGRDPVTGKAMPSRTAEKVAAEEERSRRPSSTIWRCAATSSTSTRALADDRAFQRESDRADRRRRPAGEAGSRSRRTGVCARSSEKSSRRSRRSRKEAWSATARRPIPPTAAPAWS